MIAAAPIRPAIPSLLLDVLHGPLAVIPRPESLLYVAMRCTLPTSETPGKWSGTWNLHIRREPDTRELSAQERRTILESLVNDACSSLFEEYPRDFY